MSPEMQRIAIAEFLGWRKTKSGRHWVCPTAKKSPVRYRIPDFLNDLNAMRRVELVLMTDDRKWSDYQSMLRSVTLRDGRMNSDLCERLILATAAQRAEAFLKAIGKWQDNPK